MKQIVIRILVTLALYLPLWAICNGLIDIKTHNESDKDVVFYVKIIIFTLLYIAFVLKFIW